MDLLIGTLLLGFLLCYGSVVLFLASQWRSNEIYSHGFLIPVISGYLLYLQRDRIKSVTLKPNYVAGVPVLAAALMGLLSGKITGTAVIQEISLVVSIAGILLLLFGPSLLRVIWFPICYLLFMVPMWDMFTEKAQRPLQIFSATIGVGLLRAFGIPIHQSGVFLEMPNITLEVAQACSGLNYLISVIAIGIPLSYLFLKSPKRRVFIILFAAFIAILSNGLRVFLVGISVHYGFLGSDNDIHGPMHLLQALFVSVVGYLVIFLCVWAMRDDSPNLKAKRITKGITRQHVPGDDSVAPFVCAVVLIGFFAALIQIYKPIPVPPKNHLSNFPYEIGTWKGRDMGPGENLFRLNGADHELWRVYTSDTMQTVGLFIEYFEYQEQGKKLINYENDFLFRGTDTVEIDLGPEKKVKWNRHVIPGKNGETLFLYWVQIGGHILPDRYQERAFTLWNAIANRRTNGALIVVSVDIPGGTGVGKAQYAGEEFIRQVHALLPGYIP